MRHARFGCGYPALGAPWLLSYSRFRLFRGNRAGNSSSILLSQAVRLGRQPCREPCRELCRIASRGRGTHSGRFLFVDAVLSTKFATRGTELGPLDSQVRSRGLGKIEHSTSTWWTRIHVDCGDLSPLCFRFGGPARAGLPAAAHAGGVPAISRRLSAATPPVHPPPLSHPGGMAAGRKAREGPSRRVREHRTFNVEHRTSNVEREEADR